MHMTLIAVLPVNLENRGGGGHKRGPTTKKILKSLTYTLHDHWRKS